MKCLKPNYLACFFFLVATSLFGQESFYVLYVHGDILYYSESDSIGRPLMEEDVIVDNPRFKFLSESSFARVMSDERAELYFWSPEMRKSRSSEWLFYIKDNLLPKEEFFGTRSDGENTIKLFFKENKLYANKRIRASFIPKDSLSYYDLAFSSPEKEHSSKLKIDSNGYLEITDESFGLDSKQLELVDIRSIGLDFRNGTTTTRIHSVNFEKVDLDVVGNTVKYYKRYLEENGHPSDKVHSILVDFLNETYGIELKLSDLEIE